MDNYTELREEIAALKAREQLMIEALEKISNINWGWDGDCGAQSIADEALSSNLSEAKGSEHSEHPNAKLYKAQDDVVEAAKAWYRENDIDSGNALREKVAILEQIEQEMK